MSENTQAFSQITLTRQVDLEIESQTDLYCRASSSTGSATSGPATDSIDGGSKGWTENIPAASVEYPYIWKKTITVYKSSENESYTTYSLYTTIDSIEVDTSNIYMGTNFFFGTKIYDEDENAQLYKYNSYSPYNPDDLIDGNIYTTTFYIETVKNIDKIYLFIGDHNVEYLKNSGIVLAEIDLSTVGSENNNAPQLPKLFSQSFIFKQSENNNFKKISLCIKTKSFESQFEKDDKGVQINVNAPRLNIKWFTVQKGRNEVSKWTSTPSKEEQETRFFLDWANFGLPGMNDKETWNEYMGSFGFLSNSEGETFTVTKNFAADYIQAGTLKSNNYIPPESGNATDFAESGFALNLDEAYINSTNMILYDGGIITKELTATGADIEGTVKANSGTIGKLEISDDGLSIGDNIFIGDNGKWCLALGIKKENEITNATFYVNSSGEMTAKAGNVGGLTINEQGISAPNNSFSFNNDGNFSFGGGSFSGDKDSISVFPGQDKLNKIIFDNNGFSVLKDSNNSNEKYLSISNNGINIEDKVIIDESKIQIGNENKATNLIIEDNNIKFNTLRTIYDKNNQKSSEIITPLNIGVDENNNAQIVIGEPSNSRLEINGSQITFFKKDPAEGIKKSLSITDTGFTICTDDIPVANSNDSYFNMSNKLAYNSITGMIFSSDACGAIRAILDSNDNDVKQGNYTWNSIDGEKNQEVNLIITSGGLGFYSNDITEPIAYFNKDKMYVNRTQVLDRQQISNFIWQNRTGSNYNGDNKNNLSLKWVD